MRKPIACSSATLDQSDPSHIPFPLPLALALALPVPLLALPWNCDLSQADPLDLFSSYSRAGSIRKALAIDSRAYCQVQMNSQTARMRLESPPMGHRRPIPGSKQRGVNTRPGAAAGRLQAHPARLTAFDQRRPPPRIAAGGRASPGQRFRAGGRPPSLSLAAMAFHVSCRARLVDERAMEHFSFLSFRCQRRHTFAPRFVPPSGPIRAKNIPLGH
jgi:hypothetical protein